MAINISDNNPRVNYTATSGQTVFTVPFEFFASTDLTVYVDGSVLAVSDYTVTGGSGSTGSITTDSGQSTGAKIAIVRDVPLERTTDLTSTYSASSLNDQLDRIVTQIADLDDRVSRSISLNDYEVGVSLDLPATASRLGKTIQFNSSTGALEVGPSGNELTSIASIASEITALDGIKANITTVAGAITNVNSVGSNISSVTSVAGSISNVNTVNTNIANVNSVATSITDVNDVADSIDQVELVAGSISNVDTVALANSNISSVASNISNVNTVAGISSNVTTVAGITSAISTVNSNATNINLVATNIDDVNDVANVVTKVTTVADNIANVNTVAPSVGYLSTVANNISNINTLAPISADITTVAGVASSVSSAAANAAAAESAKVAAEAAQAAAELAADNFDDTYLGSKSSDPTVDNDGDALTAGDLYFSTTDNNLKVYSGSAWQAAALDASGFVDVTGDTMTGNLLFGDGVQARFGTHGDLTFEHDLNNSNIVASNNKPLNITANGVFNINSDNIYFREHAASNTYMEMRDGGGYDHAVRIFHSGTNVRLETTSTGIDVTGTVTADGLIFDAADFINITAKESLAITIDSDNNQSSRNFTIFNDGTTKKLFRAEDTGDISFYEDTGSTAKFFWDASAESLGIGTSSPSYAIDTLSSGSVVAQFKRDATGGGSGGIRFGNNDKQFTLYGDNSNGLTIYDGVSERMRIDSSGRVGIGTSSPDLTLDVSHNVSSEYVATFQNTADNLELKIGTTSGLLNIQGANASNNAAYQIALNAEGGNVGIGTSSPSELIELSSASDPRIRINNSANTLSANTIIGGLEFYTNDASAGGTGIGASIDAYAQSNFGSNQQGLYLTFSTRDSGSGASNTERMRIDSSGNVGIGTSSGLGGKLDITLGTDARGYFSNSVSEVGSGNFALQVVNSAGSALKPLGFRAEDIRFATGSSERMRIDSSGNLLVGKTVSSFATAGTTILPSGNVTFTRSGAGVVDVNRLSSDGSLINLYKDGSSVGGIGTRLGRLKVGFSDVGLFFDNTNDRINPEGPDNTGSRDAAIDLGHSSGRFKDLHLSGTAYVGLSSVISAGDQGIQVDGGNGIIYIGRGSTSVSTHISFLNPNGEVGKITTTGSSTSYVTSSDYRLKENVVNLTSATTRLKQLEPKRFNFIADADTTVDGFFAHEVQSVVPEAVTGAKDAMRDEEYEVTPAVLDDDGNVVTEAVMGTRSVPDYQGIDQSKLVPLLVATIKELEARITALENA